MLAAIDAPESPAVTRRVLNQMDAIPDAPLEFDCRTDGNRIRMRPFYRIQREKHSTYLSMIRG
jgi:hypothetical protein